MKIILLSDFRDNPSEYIWLNRNEIVYDSIFAREFNGDIKLLLDCIENNINDEEINHSQAIKDYQNEENE